MASSQTSVNNLVSSLESLSVSQPKLVKRTAYTFPPDVTPFGSSSSQSHALTSWKMAEHMYKADPCMLPTLARGLFTEQLDSVNGEKPGGDKSEKGNYRIVARGYEKFFNIDEMSYTKVRIMTRPLASSFLP
jgi:tRNA ligase